MAIPTLEAVDGDVVAWAEVFVRYFKELSEDSNSSGQEVEIKLGQIEAELAQTKQINVAQEQKINDQTATILSLEQEIANLTATSSSAGTTISNLQSSISALTADVTTLQTTTATNTTAISANQTQLADHEARLVILEAP